MHRSKIGQIKGIKKLILEIREAFPGQKVDIIKYSEQNAFLQYTAGHTDCEDSAGFAIILFDLRSKSDIMPHYANFPKPANIAENYANLIRQCLFYGRHLTAFPLHLRNAVIVLPQRRY